MRTPKGLADGSAVDIRLARLLATCDGGSMIEKIRKQASHTGVLPVENGARASSPPSRKGRRPQPDAGAALSGRERILDVAEAQFANFGYYGTTIRNVTRAAAVDLSMVHYHFGDKDGLFTALIERRTHIINDDIGRRFDALPPSPSVEAVVSAYIGATVERLVSGGSGWRDHFRLTTNAANLADKRHLIEPMTKAHRPVMKRCIKLLAAAIPCADTVRLTAVVHMMAVSTARIADEDRLPSQLTATVRLPSYREYADLMVQTFAAGFRALA